MIKLRFCCRIIPGRGKEESEQGGELNHRGRLGGAEKGGNVGDGCVVELLQPMWGWPVFPTGQADGRPAYRP